MDRDSTTASSDGPPDRTEPDPAPAPLPLPEKVERLATARGLGAYQAGAEDGLPLRAGIAMLVLAGLLSAAAWALDVHGDAGFLAVASVAIVLIALPLAGIGVVALLDGFQVSYLFAGGVVWARRRRMEVVPWPEVDELVVAGGLFPDRTPTGGLLVAIDGRETFIGFTAGSAEFGERLVAAVRAANRPVVADTPKPRGLPPGESRAKAFLVLFAASFVAVPAVVYLVLVLCSAVGLPFGAALFLVFAMTSLAAVLSRRMRIGAVLFAGAAALFLILQTNRSSDANVVTVTSLVLAALVATVYAWRRLARRLPAPRRLGPRRRLGHKQGWRYEDAAEVPVPGPRSAHELIGVPNAATTARGHGVLVATANGFECTVYDMVRRRPRLGDPIRTVWQIALPVPMPGYYSTELSWPTFHRAHRGDAPAALQMLTTVYEAVPAPLHPHWWVEGRFLCSRTDLYASPKAIAWRIDYLTDIASQIPWEQLADPAAWQLPEVPPAAPTPSLPPWDASRLAGSVSDALRLAESEVAAGTPLTTGRVFAALARVDWTLGWERLWLQTGAPENIGLATAADPESADVPADRTHPELSAALSRALSLAEKIRSHYRLPVVTTGVAALALVAFRDAGATEALLSGGQVDHGRLLSQIEAEIAGTRFEGLLALLPATPN